MDKQGLRYALELIEHEVRDMREIANGSMYGEPTFPSPDRFERVLHQVAWIKAQAEKLAD